MIGWMFVIFVICLALAVPVGFSIGISATFFLVFGSNIPISIVVQKMVDGINSFSYLALPLFVLSGAIMVYGSTPRLMRLANLLLGRLPGGLGAAGSLGCGFFGAISGSGVATTASIGAIVAPEMVRQGYDKGFTASLIPPAHSGSSYRQAYAWSYTRKMPGCRSAACFWPGSSRASSPYSCSAV